MTMSGMDTAAIRQVAGQLSQHSESIAETRQRVDSLLELVRHHWQGDDVRQFDSRWMDQYRGICLRLHENLADLARIARDNADAQDRVSGDLQGGSSGVTGRPWDTGPRLGGAVGSQGQMLPEMYNWLVSQGSLVGKAIDYSTLGMVLKYGVGAVKTLDDVPAWKGLNGFLGGLGILSGTVDTAEGVSTDDYGKAWGGVVDVALGVAGVALGVEAAPIVIPLTIAKTFVDATIPYSSESQNSLLDYQAERMFGNDATHLTPEQSQALSQHYEGVGGVVNMLSDKMDQTGEPIAKAGDAFFRWVGWKK
jgi:WXG100 family type VII secretion target